MSKSFLKPFCLLKQAKLDWYSFKTCYNIEFCFWSGTVVVQTQAQYPDGSRNGISYSIFSGNKLQSFGISATTGEFVQ